MRRLSFTWSDFSGGARCKLVHRVCAVTRGGLALMLLAGGACLAPAVARAAPSVISAGASVDAEAHRQPPAGAVDADEAGRADEDDQWLEIDRLELVSRARQPGANGGGGAYDATVRLGEGAHRFVGKAEGDWRGGRLDDSRSEVHYGHLFPRGWIGLVGWRHDTAEGPHREWFSLGADGPLPGDLETEWSFNVGAGGRTAFRLAVEHDVDIGARWVVQPSLELNAYGRDDPENGVGRGLSDVRLRLRLQHRLTPSVAPYLAVQWDGAFGETRRLARDEGELTRETRLALGVGFAF